MLSELKRAEDGRHGLISPGIYPNHNTLHRFIGDFLYAYL